MPAAQCVTVKLCSPEKSIEDRMTRVLTLSVKMKLDSMGGRLRAGPAGSRSAWGEAWGGLESSWRRAGCHSPGRCITHRDHQETRSVRLETQPRCHRESSLARDSGGEGRMGRSANEGPKCLPDLHPHPLQAQVQSV